MTRREIVEAIGRTIMRWQDATEAYDDAVGEIAGLNGAERRCLSFLHDGPKTAGAIAAATGLTPAAITALVDRLEARGYLVRRRSEKDRRQVLVEYGPVARELTARYYEPLAREGDEMMKRYSDAELAAVLRFLSEAVRIQEGRQAALKQAGAAGTD